MQYTKSERIEKIFDKFTSSKYIHESVIYIENTTGDFSFHKGYKGKEIDSPMITASITKLFTTTCILILLEQEKLSLDDKLSNYLDNSLLKGLHIFKGKDYSFDLSIFDLLFQTSGLPDIYEEGKESFKKKTIAEDFFIKMEDVIPIIKKMTPHFAPQSCNKAYYADINFDLLGIIIEKICGISLAEVYKQYIFTPLNMNRTYLSVKETNNIPGIFYKDQILYRPKVISSCGASGGCISTCKDLIIFLKSFFGGKLFKKDIFQKLSIYHKLQASMGPIYYGGGYMAIPLHTLNTLYLGKGELIGHSGSTGSFAFYYPVKDLFFVGDVNQMSNPALPIRLIMQLAMMV